MKRQLATIQKIKNIKSIAGRDRVDQANVLGWTVIIGKGIYQENDLVVFFEIDSLFPKEEIWADLEKFKYRIKTFKVNSEDGIIYGQGYCFSLDVFKEAIKNKTWDSYFDVENFKDIQYIEGLEITELLGITKYEAPDPTANSMLMGDQEGVFPTQYVSKTDETRLESCLDVLGEINNLPYIIRMKIDGTSWTALKIDDEYKICSRNNMLKEPAGGKRSNYWDMFYKYPNLKNLLNESFAVQAEMYGEGIQGNKLGIKGKNIAIFNIIDLKTRTRVDNDMLEELCSQFELPLAPLVESDDCFKHGFESLKELSDNLKYQSGKPAEGIVVRPKSEKYSNILKGSLSFKQISRVFLSKGGD